MRLLVLTAQHDTSTAFLPALDLLDHRLVRARLGDVADAPTNQVDAVVVDATGDLRQATLATRELACMPDPPAVLVVFAESALAVIQPSWSFDDWVVQTCGPAELATRLRLLEHREALADTTPRAASIGDLVVDEESYQVRLRGEPMDLTYREFELLRALVSHPNRVFTREVLLQEVWGYDYFGGSRTVDVHVRRLRAKLGAEHEQMIATVRGVGYKLVPPGSRDGRGPTDR